MVRHVAVLIAAVVAMSASATLVEPAVARDGPGTEAPSGTAPQANPADLVQIYQLEATFDRALSTKNLDLMMSLWDDGAILSSGDGSGYEGTDQIRDWFATSAQAFKPDTQWLSLTALPDTRVTVRGDRASLHFEVYYVEAATRALRAEATVNATLARVNGRWLIADAVFGPAGL